MDSFVHRQNIANFRSQLERESDPAKRAVLQQLLAEEQQKLHAAGHHAEPDQQREPMRGAPGE